MKHTTAAELRFRKAIIAASGVKRRKRKQPKKPRRPRRAQVKYTAELTSIIKGVEDIIKEVFLPGLERVATTNALERPTERHDAAADDLERLIGDVRLIIAKRFTPATARAAAVAVANDVNDLNRADIEENLLSVVGISLGTDPGIGALLDAAVRENVRLITNLPEALVEDIAGITSRGVRRGRRSSEMAVEIQERFGVSRRRAQLIARDQVSKLNGELTQLRHQALGITRYRWRATLDGKTRDEHAAREGQIFEWDNPPEDGHPGEPINCRCGAEPVLDDLLAP